MEKINLKNLFYTPKSCEKCLAFKNEKCEFGYKIKKYECYNTISIKPLNKCPKPTSKKMYEEIKKIEKELLKNYWYVEI